MNKTTLALKVKGYSLTEFLQLMNISLSTYRRYENDKHPMNSALNTWINDLEKKQLERF